MSDQKTPHSVVILMGQSGVGKGMMVDALRKSILAEDADVVHVAANVDPFGAAQGYVGYKDGGILAEAVQRAPNHVVLLDESDKGHE